MGEKEIAEFLTFLAVEENVASSTQNQALKTIVFLYKKVLNLEKELNIVQPFGLKNWLRRLKMHIEKIRAKKQLLYFTELLS